MSPRIDLSYRVRIGVLVASAAAAIAAALLVDRFDAPESYYHFADTRPFLGVPNFMDIASNVGFLIAGALGLAYLWGGDERADPVRREVRWPYTVFFGGVLLTTFGAATFHLEPLLADGTPDSDGMVWDRLPITVAFMALLAAFVADRVHAGAGLVALPLLVAAGVAATLYWYATYNAGAGDLRPYALVQAYPALAIVLICWLFPGRHTHGRYVLYLLLWYGIAKAFEAYDGKVYDLLGSTVSGHTVKHLLAAVAACVVLAMLRRTAPEGKS
jgi:hypothetical protein